MSSDTNARCQLTMTASSSVTSPWYLYKQPGGQSRWKNTFKELRQFRYPRELSWHAVPHPKPLPADFTEAGRSCLRMQAAPGWGIGHGRLVVHMMKGEHQNFYNTVFPGKKYRFSCWMRQEGIPGGQVEIEDRGLPELTRVVAVDGNWQKYEFDFVPKRPSTSGNATIKFDGGGTLWLDAVRLYELDRVPTSARCCRSGNGNSRIFEGTQPGNRGVLRYWGLQSNGHGSAASIHKSGSRRPRGESKT